MSTSDITEITNKVTIKFPCVDYVIKIIGNNSSDFIPTVTKIVKQNVPDLQESSMQIRTSKNAKFITAQFLINATSIAQLKTINSELLATNMVRMVL